MEKRITTASRAREKSRAESVSVRMLSHQLASPQFKAPEEVVSHFGAVQAQDYRMMRWAVSMRTVRPSMEAFRKAFDDGKIVRLHLLRGTWQLVSAEDYWWMLRLCGPRSEAVIRGWMRSNKIEIPEEELLKVREILAGEARRGGSVTKEDFVRALAGHGITMDDHRLSYHIRMSELSGTLCSGELQPLKATYSLSESKLGAEPSPADMDESLALLARKYFRSHSPATLEDFVWWSGLGIGDCRKAVAVLGDELHTETLSGREFLVHCSCRTRGFRKGRVLLLPPYDEYLIGYKSRDIVLDGEFSHRAHNKTGIFYPVILHDGRVCGNWKPAGMSLDFFEECPADESAVSKAKALFSDFMAR